MVGKEISHENPRLLQEESRWFVGTLAPLTIKTNMGEVTIVPGTSFRTGVEFMSLDIAALCEQDADI